MHTIFNRLSILLVTLLTLAPFGLAHAQNEITVITQIKPPYSPYLSDYVGFDNKIVVTLINKENSSQSVRLVGQIKGGTGLTVTIPNNFIPAAPISIGPNQSRMLTGIQLKEYLNPDVLEFSGISKQEVVQGNGLPEGDYSLCIQALDFQTGEPRSLPSPSGCFGFTITHYEPPTLLQPQCNATVTPLNPQNLLFSWTAPAGAPPNKMEYILKIAEIFPQDADPNQAMLAAPDPPFFETVVQSTSFLYGPAAPHLEIGMRYAVRVTARNKGESKELNFKNGGNSVVCAFTYGQGQLADDKNQNDVDEDQNNDIQEEYADPCTSLNCAPQPPPAATESNATYQPGDEIQIGYFTLKLTSLSSNAANNLSGEGVIDAPIFKTKLKATFQGLKVNPQHKVYSGKAIGAYDPGAQIDQSLKNFGDKVENVAAEKVKTLSDFVKNHQKYIENFANLDAQGLPFAWKKVLNSKLQLVNIASVEFAPDGARFNAFLDIPIPEANNKILAFGQKNICFHPTGLSVGGLQKLTMLGNDQTFPWGGNIDLTLKAAQGNNDGTYVKWDCEGYKEMQIDGYFTFKTSILEKAEGAGPVKASFTFSSVASWGDMVGEVSMDPFVVKGTKGLQLVFDKVILDFSDTRNAQGMAFPANYNGTTSNDWRGFYFKKLSVTLPKYLKNKNAPVEITMKDALITKLGFTGSVTVQPVISLGDGNLGGWAFSMEKIGIEILNNSLTKGEFNGSIKIPIATTALGYKCLLSNSDQGLKTAFQVNTLGDIDADMWAAKLSLKEGSGISIESQGENVTVKAILSGSLTVDKKFVDLKGVSVKIPGVEFQDLTIQNKKPYLSATLFKFASPQKFFAGFPVSINPQDGIQVKFAEDGTKAGLRLSFHVGLDGNEQSAISGGTAFTLWAQMSQQNGKQVWQPSTPTLESIQIKASVASCDIEGKIDLYKGDEKFGDGFRGAIMVNFRPIVKLSATVQFGSTKYKANDTYRYWYVDAMAVMGQGIPVFPGFGIYGFGGGAYYHMKPQSVVPAAAELAGDPNNTKFQQDTPGQSASNVEYVPDKNIVFGFKASIVMGTMPKPNAFNGDITLEASFFQGGGLNEISLSGNGYFVSVPDPKNRPAKNKSIITASVMFKYSSAKKSFDGMIDVHINLGSEKTKLIEGGGQASMHFSKDKWFIKLGEPNNRIGLTVLDLLNIDSYFMVGKNSLPGIPPLPTTPINFQAKLPSFNSKNPRDPQVGTGSGFALGQQLDINTGKLKFLIFYARIAVAFGYDISVLDLNADCEYSEGKMGLNGWYAVGQVYAGIDAAVGIDINLWFLKTDVELFQVGLYAGLQAGLPNPTWLKGEVAGEYSALGGLLKGHCTFKFKYGNKCDLNSGDPFGGVKVIADIKPTGNDVDVFSYPEVAYNLPIGETMSIETVNDNDDVVVTTFRFGVKSFEVKNTKTKANIAGDHALVNKNMSSLFTPDEMLDEKTEYKLTIKIYGDKRVKGVWKRIGEQNNPNVEHLEIGEKTFRTGDAPETFVNSNIIATLPGRMQRYFYYSQTTKGFIAFNQYPSNIPKMKPKDDDYTYKFVARFQEVGSGSKVVGESPITWEPQADKKRVSFGLPAGLKAKTIYIVQIVRQKVKNPQKIFSSGSSGNVSSTTTTKNIGDGQTINVRESRLNSIKLGDNEFLVYQMAFKTSQFFTFKAKLDDYLTGNREVTTGTGDYKNTIYVRYTGKEPFDWYDLHQSSYSQGSVTKYIEPDVTITARDRSGALGDPLWLFMKEDYFDYLNDSYLNSMISTEVLQNKKNPRVFRDYPSPGAYPPGSRLTNGSFIPANLFPEHAVGLSYEGNGVSGKLTNDEINASYWKNIDDGGVGNGLVLNTIKATDQKSKTPFNNGMSLAQNTVNKLVIRYDPITVLIHDRAKVLKEMISRYGLNPSGLSMNPTFQGYLKFNSPTIFGNGKENPYYWELKLRKNSPYVVNIDFGYGTFNKKEIQIKLP